jgi:hypothetical protein
MPLQMHTFGSTSFVLKHLTASGIVVGTLRHAHAVSRATRKAFEQPDPSDPTLAVDNLGDLFPSPADSEVDPTLAVTALQELFPARPARPVPIEDMYPAAASDSALQEDNLDDYFPDRDEAATNANDDASGPTVKALCFPDTDEASTDAYDDEPGPTVKALCFPDTDDTDEASTDTYDDEPGPTVKAICVESDIHRAAMDFLRFAEKFHAFASEHQRGGS